MTTTTTITGGATGPVRLEEYDTSERYLARVVTSERITPIESDEDVREIVLEVDRPEFTFEVGQSIGVLAPGDPAFGKEHHLRLYSVADLPESGDDGRPRIRICVRRCSYVDEYNGELYQGVASNYLCNLEAGDELTITGPYGLPFEVPEDHDANLILIGTGTGIAPFRALVKHIYRDIADWRGRIWLFYGARSGLELLYMNRERDDFSQYYDHETFEAFQALSPRPHWGDPIAWHDALSERAEELWAMLGESDTYVYLAGLEKTRDELDKVLETIAGSETAWQERKRTLLEERRWVELLY